MATYYNLFALGTQLSPVVSVPYIDAFGTGMIILQVDWYITKKNPITPRMKVLGAIAGQCMVQYMVQFNPTGESLYLISKGKAFHSFNVLGKKLFLYVFPAYTKINKSHLMYSMWS